MSINMEPYVIPASGRSGGNPRRVAINPECQDDPFQRYWMYQLVVDLQGKQARLLNLDTVAKNLQTSAEYLATYLASGLNAAVKRTTSGKQAGATTSWALYPATFTLQKMDTCLRSYLTNVVLCPSCSLPELVHIVDQPEQPQQQQPQPERKKGKKGSAASAGRVHVKCQSCRWNETLEKRMRQVQRANAKFAEYVLAHPPTESDAGLGELRQPSPTGLNMDMLSGLNAAGMMI